MEQGCPHRSILPHIFPDCNSFAIKIGGKFCGVRGVCPGGGLPRRCRLGGCQRYPAGGAGGQSPTNPAFSFAFAPIPPPALAERSSRREGGDYRFILPGAAAPGTPALNRLRHLQFPPYRYPAKGCLWLGAKTTEILSFGQCRQPRRGGTGGDGTIRRTRRRRLRWSSPPGQG